MIEAQLVPTDVIAILQIQPYVAEGLEWSERLFHCPNSCR